MERAKKGFVQNIEALAEDNRDFRRVLYTSQHSQLVLMTLPPGEHSGAEVHPDVDQFFRVEEGMGEVLIGEKRMPIGPGAAIVIPAGTRHDILNTGSAPLNLYTLYSPPHHRDGVVHRTREDAERDKEHFDGKTTE
jgi:mannose-6-phosphate isomerase-like protein (cupin superfamily)